MAKPRELRRRIKSVQSTRKITKTMELVATSKLKRAQDRVIAARPYAAALAEVMGDLYAPELAERFPLLRQPAGKSRRVALVVITANRRLCGAFNANLIREARRRIEQLEGEGAGVDLHLIGKKGITYFKDRKSTRLNSSHGYISYAVFCLKKKNTITFTVFPEIVRSIGNSFINTMKNINHTRSSISDDIRNILCSSANMRRAIPLILRLLMN